MNAIHPAVTGQAPTDGPVRVAAVLCGPCDDSITWQLPADPLSVPQARALCREAARAWADPEHDVARCTPGKIVTAWL